MGITILDVAREAGVSKSTVSLVINNSPAIKQETHYKVQQAIQKLGYVPNYAARDLSSKRTYTLGLIFLTANPDKLPYAFDAVPETLLYDASIGIQARLQNSQYTLLTERFAANRNPGLPELVTSGRVDGVFLIGGLYDEAFMRRLQETKIPTVLVGRQHEGIDSVLSDLEMMGYLGGRALFEKGHRNVLFLSGPAQSSNTIAKQKGLERASREHGQGANFKCIHSGHAGLDAYIAIRSAWEHSPRFDAIFAGSDGIAGGVLRFLHEQKVRVPDDISMISYERSVITEYIGTPLTVIDPHKEQMGEEACRALLNRIARPRTTPVTLKINPELIDYGSIRDKRP